MTFIPGRPLPTALWVGLTTLVALAACGVPQPPIDTLAPRTTVTLASSLWPAPAAPLDNTAIGPVETAGAAAND